MSFSSSDEESLVRTNTPHSSPLHGGVEPLSLVHHHLDYHHTSTPDTDDSFHDAKAEEEEEEEEEEEDSFLQLHQMMTVG